MRISILSQALAEPPTGKGERESQSFHFPCLWPRRFWKHLAMCGALLCRRRGKVSDDHNPFTSRACGRAVFGSALPSAKALLCRRRGKVSDDHNPFTSRACGRAVFGSALPYAKHCSAFGARTRRARQNCSALDHWRSDCLAIRGRAGAQAAKQLLCHSWQSRGAGGSAIGKATNRMRRSHWQIPLR